MVIKAVFWGFGMSVMFSFKRGAEYQLVVDEDEGEISTKNRLGIRMTPRFTL